MGKAGDPDAVVDSRGKVFGVHGLRVVDVSAFPLLPPGHIQSTVCKRDIFLPPVPAMGIFQRVSRLTLRLAFSRSRYAGGKVGRRH